MPATLSPDTVQAVPEVGPVTYPYTQVAEYYRAQIRDGTLAAGAPFPSLRKIREEWPTLSHATLQRAVQLLREGGFVVGEHGKRTHVADHLPP